MVPRIFIIIRYGFFFYIMFRVVLAITRMLARLLFTEQSKDYEIWRDRFALVSTSLIVAISAILVLQNY